MKFGKTTIDEKMKVTWITVTGLPAELDQCIWWIDRNKTLWVVNGQRNVASELSMSDLFRFKQEVPHTQKFGFRHSADALRFKLSMVSN